MRRATTFLALILAWTAAGAASGRKPATRPKASTQPAYTPNSGYEDRQLMGWTLRVHKDLLRKERAKLLADTLRELENHFYRIRRVVPAEAVRKLQKVVLWVEYRNPKQAHACYHPSRGWLASHGYNPDKAKGVELGSAATFLRAVGHQPWMILHELAHAYHDQVLGWDHPEIKSAYARAKKSGTYEKVLIWNGRIGRHYAMTNHKEYFAENTEAYFGTNDIYPFVRAELKRHDPTVYRLLEKLWGVRKGTKKRRPGGGASSRPASAPPTVTKALRGRVAAERPVPAPPGRRRRPAPPRRRS